MISDEQRFSFILSVIGFTGILSIIAAAIISVKAPTLIPPFVLILLVIFGVIHLVSLGFFLQLCGRLTLND